MSARLRATAPLRVGRVVVSVVQRVRVERVPGRRLALHAAAEPRAIVVGEAGRWRALGTDGAEVALAPLLREADGLAELVEREGAAGAPQPDGAGASTEPSRRRR